MKKLLIIASILCFLVTSTFVQAADVRRTPLTQDELLTFAEEEKTIETEDSDITAGAEDPWILLLAGIGLIVILAAMVSDNSDTTD